MRYGPRSHTCPLTMPQSAPVVLRCGNVVAHCNDPSAVMATLQATGSMTVSRAPSDHELHTMSALKHFEDAMASARDVCLGSSPGAAAQSLKQLGMEHLASRLRNASGSRGAIAHPDTQLAKDILTHTSGAMLDRLAARAEMMPQAVEPPSAAAPPVGLISGSARKFLPTDLCDDRRLRRPRPLPRPPSA